MRRWACCVGALLVVVSACGDPDTDSADSEPQTTTTMTTMIASIVPHPGTYWGEFEAQEGLTGRVAIEVAESGTEITDLKLIYEMTDFTCGGRTYTIEYGLFQPLELEVALIDGAFAQGSDLRWEGVFVSGSRVEGTVGGELGMGSSFTGCEIGSLAFWAELDTDSSG